RRSRSIHRRQRRNSDAERRLRTRGAHSSDWALSSIFRQSFSISAAQIISVVASRVNDHIRAYGTRAPASNKTLDPENEHETLEQGCPHYRRHVRHRTRNREAVP